MSSYREFVKENFHSLGNMPATEKMKKLGEMWKKHKGKATMDKGKGVAGGSVAGGKMKGKGVAGGKMKGKGVAGGKMKVRKSSKSSKAMKSVGGAIPWNWEFIDPSRGISEQLQDYFIKGLVGQANPLGKATLAQIQKVGGDEQTLEYNHRYWDAKDESNRLLNAVSMDNQRRADEPSGLEKFATGALGAMAEGATKALTEGAGLKKRGRKAKGKGIVGGAMVGGATVGGATVGGALSQKEKMKMKKQMHKLETISHNKKLTKLQEKKLKHLHNLHGGNLLDV